MSKNTLTEFTSWWLTGLNYLLPQAVREKLQPKHDRLIVKIIGNQFNFSHIPAETPEQETEWAILKDDEINKNATQQQLAELIKPDTRITLIIPENQVLVKSLTLPLSAAGNLREILSFEMDKQTPFNADRVYFDWILIKEDVEAQKLHIELYVLLKEYLDPLLAEMHMWHLQPCKVSLESEGQILNINLLPEENNFLHSDPARKSVIKFAIVTLVLFFIMLYAPLLRQQAILKDFESKVNESRKAAKEVLTLQKEKEAILSRLQFLDEKRNAQIPEIDILKELTSVLPDDTWLNRLMINDNEIQLYGESESATSIIELLNNSDYFSGVQFRAPVTKNNVTQRDRFQISATLNHLDAT